jgi:succinyl-CoA synthetase alpha subunit
MSILVDENTRLLVQGITGTEGSFHTQRCIEYGTKVVAGVTPGKGGSKHLGVPVFNTVEKAMAETGANTSLMFVPPAFTADGMLEAIDAGVSLIVSVTEGVPVLDTVKVHRYLKGKSTRLVGPNCAGVISPGKCKVGIMVGEIHLPGNVGVVSRSGTLAFDVATQLTSLGIGQSTCVGIGGDALPGSSFVDILKLLQSDQGTKVVVLIGEIGGTMEQEAAEFISQEMTKPVVAFIAGSTAPPGKRMGHAGAIITGNAGKASEKIKVLSQAGAIIAPTPAEVGLTTKRVLESL